MPSMTVEIFRLLREAGDGANDRLRVVALRHVAHERAVDLDLVEREAAQIGERRVAGAEVVHRDAHAEPAQLMQRRQRVGLVLQQHRFGDLEVEPARREAGRGERAERDLHQVAALELHRRQIDRDADRLGPARGLRAGGAQHPLAERDDQAGLLGERDELAGRDQAALRMVPAHQRLEAADPAVLEANDRLVVQLEFGVGDGRAEIDLERVARLQPPVHLPLEEPVGAAAVALGEIERHVGVLEQLIRAGAVGGRDRDADAGADLDRAAADLERLAEQVDDARGELAALLGARDRGLHDRRTRRRRCAPPCRRSAPRSAGGRRRA